jgi:apolipoprotein N-acyltransferase
MISFYFELLTETPRLLWESGAAVSGIIGVVGFFILFFNQELANRLTSGEGISRKWSFYFLAAYFIFLVLKANYTKFTDLAAANDAKVAEALGERDKAQRRIEIDQAQIEQLTTENAALQKGAPVITGPEARVAEMRTQLLQYADRAPTREEFTDEIAKAWVSGARRMAGNLDLASSAPYFDYDAYKGTYETLEETVALLRAFALNLNEAYLPKRTPE